MSKRPSLVKQVIDRLYSMAKFGQSKYQAKQEAIAKAQADGIQGWNPARVDGIYSIDTMQTYRKESIAFVTWAKEQYGSRYLDEAKEYTKDYLKMRIDKGDSAWTVQMTRAALRKLYQDQNLANDVNLPIRYKEDIQRSRGPKAMDKDFSVERNKDLIDFCKATGLRRHELQALKVEDIHREDGRLWVDVNQGKGGRPRSSPVLKSFENRVEEIIRGKQPDQPVIEKIPVRADIHGYRRDYANKLYEEISGKSFNPKDKDTAAILQVSWALGHNRLDVISRNYLG